MAANSKANVSTTRGHRGGYLFSAPIGTAGAPTVSNFKASSWLTSGNPPAGWECLGYIPEDGFTESVSFDSGDAILDINQDKIDEAEGTAEETMVVSLMETKAHTLGTEYGHQNVTDASGTITVKHNWAKRGEHYQYVFLLLLKDDRAWTKYIPDAKVTSLGDFTGNKNTVAQREITLSYITDADGNGCFDYIDSTETNAPQLSSLSLSGTGTTLTPTFAAGTYEYTSDATGTTATITAAAATGNTVSIEDANGNEYESADSLPLVAGTNKFTVIVTNDASGSANRYTVVITKS